MSLLEELDGIYRNKPKKFTSEEIIEELKDAIHGAPDKMKFRFRKDSELVDVYVGNSLAYVINRSLYKKIIEEDDQGSGYNLKEYPRKDL